MAKTFVILVLLCLQLLHWVSCTKLPGFSNAQRLLSKFYFLSWFSVDFHGLLALFRGGAKGKPAKKAQPISKSKRRNRYEDDEDENEDDYDDEEDDDRHYKSKRGKSTSRRTSNRGKSNRGSFSLIPWSSANNDRESSSSKKKGPSIRERLEQIAKSGQSAYKDIYRRAKVKNPPAASHFQLTCVLGDEILCLWRNLVKSNLAFRCNCCSRGPNWPDQIFHSCI